MQQSNYLKYLLNEANALWTPELRLILSRFARRTTPNYQEEFNLNTSLYNERSHICRTLLNNETNFMQQTANEVNINYVVRLCVLFPFVNCCVKMCPVAKENLTYRTRSSIAWNTDS